MKKILIILFSIVLLFIIVFGIIYLLNYKKEEIILEDYTNVVINSNIILEVYKEYKISDFIKITNGKILNDKLINTEVIGKQNIEVIYQNEDKKKFKAYFEVIIVDTVKPIILGSSLLTQKVNTKDELIYSFISADNYTRVPIREIIGEYDLTKVGKYYLTFKITDESGNFNTKDFTLNVVSKITPRNTPNTKTIYEDVFKKHKNENTKIGLDISKWQGDVNYDKLKENNVEFIMFRIGYQKGYDKELILDEKFERNIKEANRVGIPAGLYFYSYANSIEDSKEQALWIIDKIKNYDISLPIAFDFEDWYSFSKQNMSIREINNIAIGFMKTIEDNGYKGINYSSKYYLENIWNIDEYPVWLAHYTIKTDYSGEYFMWQLCQDGRIEGINGPVDINVMYNNK